MKVTKTNGDGTVQFVCPACGGHRLEEVLINAHVETLLTFQLEPSRTTGIRMTYGQAFCVKGDIERYQCSVCGFSPKDKDGNDICDDSYLIDWLNNPVGIEKILDENDAADLKIPLG